MIPFLQSDGGRVSSGFAYEDNDCTVRAISIAASIPYSTVHAVIAAAGRREGHSFPFVSWMCGQRKLGSYGIRPCKEWIGAKTINQLVAKNLPGRYIVRIRGHVFAMIDGVIHDNTLLGGKCRIINLWRLD